MKEKVKIRASLPIHEMGDHESSVPRSLRVGGLVVKCLDLTLADLELMPQHELRDDFRCREGWAVRDLIWRGVLLQTILALAEPNIEARHIQASAGDFSISVPLDRAAHLLLAISLNGTEVKAGRHAVQSRTTSLTHKAEVTRDASSTQFISRSYSFSES